MKKQNRTTLENRARAIGYILDYSSSKTIARLYAEGCPVKVSWELRQDTQWQHDAIGCGTLDDVAMELDQLEVMATL